MDEFRNFNYAANFRLKNELKKTNFLSAAMLLNISKYQKTSFVEMLEVFIELLNHRGAIFTWNRGL